MSSPRLDRILATESITRRPFLANSCILTKLLDFPGHIHAFYVEYVYFDRRERARRGELTGRDAPGVYSDRVQSGGFRRQGYGTMN